jgi:hypothetical protein
MSAFVAHVDGDYALQVPAAMTISLRGMHLMLRDFTRDYERPPRTLLMTQDVFRFLCREAVRDHKTFADQVDTETPRFEGVPIAFIDAGRMDKEIF